VEEVTFDVDSEVADIIESIAASAGVDNGRVIEAMFKLALEDFDGDIHALAEAMKNYRK